MTLAGERMRTERDITVSALLREKKVAVVPGNLLNVRGKVIQPKKGKPAYVIVNGARVSFGSVVHAGDAVDPRNGENVTEPLVTRKVPIPPETKIVGSGRYLAVNAPGRSGVRLDHLGVLSKIVTKREVIRQPIATVLLRTNTPPPKMVALTFDDGPWPKQTMAIAKILLRYEVPATFFVLGQQVAKYPEVVQRLVEDGFVIGNHTYTHPNLTDIGVAEVRRQLTWTQKAVIDAAKRRTYWVRPPGGNTDAAVKKVTAGMGMRQMLWDLDSRDWTKPGHKAIVKTVLSEMRPGYIVLMHDGGGDRTQTLRALPFIIKGLRAKGYSFVTLDDLYKIPDSKSRLPAKAKPVAARTTP